MVITDSGGLQKEAYFAGKRALIVMPDTGWRELIEIGWNKLVNIHDIYINYQGIVYERSNSFRKTYIYGEGESARKTFEILENGIGRQFCEKKFEDIQ